MSTTEFQWHCNNITRLYWSCKIRTDSETTLLTQMKGKKCMMGMRFLSRMAHDKHTTLFLFIKPDTHKSQNTTAVIILKCNKTMLRIYFYGKSNYGVPVVSVQLYSWWSKYYILNLKLQNRGEVWTLSTLQLHAGAEQDLVLIWGVAGRPLR